LAVIEIGAGSAVPTVRYNSQNIVADYPEATLIRFNPEEPQIPAKLGERHISVKETDTVAFLEAVQKIVQSGSAELAPTTSASSSATTASTSSLSATDSDSAQYLV